jgi:hypothetical protein
MNRREFVKKIGGAGVAVMAGVGIVAATAPRKMYIAGVDPITGTTRDKVLMFEYSDGVSYWIHPDEYERQKKVSEMMEKSFNDILLYGEEIYKISYG